MDGEPAGAEVLQLHRKKKQSSSCEHSLNRQNVYADRAGTHITRLGLHVSIHLRTKSTIRTLFALDPSYSLERGRGMIISRKPKSRASTENAPGPTRTTTATTTTRRQTSSFDENRFVDGAGIRQLPHPSAANPTNVAAIGVKKPAKTDIPSAEVQKTMIQLLRSEREVPVSCTAP